MAMCMARCRAGIDTRYVRTIHRRFTKTVAAADGDGPACCRGRPVRYADSVRLRAPIVPSASGVSADGTTDEISPWRRAARRSGWRRRGSPAPAPPCGRPWRHRHRLVDVVGGGHFCRVDRDDDVAGLEAAVGGVAVGIDIGDHQALAVFGRVTVRPRAIERVGWPACPGRWSSAEACLSLAGSSPRSTLKRLGLAVAPHA